MASSKIQTGLRLQETTYEKARSLSVLERRSLNNLIEYAVEKYIQDYEALHGPIPDSGEVKP